MHPEIQRDRAAPSAQLYWPTHRVSHQRQGNANSSGHGKYSAANFLLKQGLESPIRRTQCLIITSRIAYRYGTAKGQVKAVPYS